jgi:hypothetical protein
MEIVFLKIKAGKQMDILRKEACDRLLSDNSAGA